MSMHWSCTELGTSESGGRGLAVKKWVALSQLRL